jgi:hypothetical protein
LADFVKWGMDKYPAEHYALIISDHGGGWQGAVEDDSANTWMTLPKLREGLEQAEAQTGRKLDFLGFDACLMASVEVVKELGPHADYMAVSEQTEGADGWGYSQLLNPQLLQTMQQAHMMKINVTPRELAVLSVTQAQSKQDVLPTMTAIDTSKVDGVVAAVDQLGSAIAETETPVSALKDIISDTTSFYGFKDVGHFSNNVLASEQVQDQKIKDAATAVKSAGRGGHCRGALRCLSQRDRADPRDGSLGRPFGLRRYQARPGDPLAGRPGEAEQRQVMKRLRKEPLTETRRALCPPRFGFR